MTLLTARERDVVELLAMGRTPKQIAYDWRVSLATVRSAIMHAKRKTGSRTISELVALFSDGSAGNTASEATTIQLEPPLTPRQLEVAELLAKGLRANEIAATLGISERQVRRHIARAVERIGARTTAELVAHVVRLRSGEVYSTRA